MANEVLQAIANIYKKDDPGDADFYTLEWVQSECAAFNQSPEEVLAELQAIEARRATMPVVTEDAPWTKDLPAHYVDKLSGPVDGFSYGLMEKSGELAKLNAAMEAEQANAQGLALQRHHLNEATTQIPDTSRAQRRGVHLDRRCRGRARCLRPPRHRMRAQSASHAAVGVGRV
jgi:hypothetical protein